MGECVGMGLRVTRNLNTSVWKLGALVSEVFVVIGRVTCLVDPDGDVRRSNRY